MSTLDKESDDVFSQETITKWREGVQARRQELFQRNWKNKRPVVQQRSRSQEAAFKFILDWTEEFEEVVARERERNRLDKLMSQARNIKVAK